MIRIIHTMGGCGGTLLSRCVGVLPGVALLSEINPGSVKLYPQFDPLYQDRAWLHLLGRTEADHFSKRDLGIIGNFRELVGMFHDRASAAARHLVLRDHNYVDFVGIPFIADPARRLALYMALPPALSTTSVAFIRHPIDQWLSLCKHEQVRAVLTPSVFCEGYAVFLQELGTKQIYKYEDFVQNPSTELRAICNDLVLPFEPSFKDRFHKFDCVTGDLTRLREQAISAPKKKALPPALIDEFRSSTSFKYILKATGYADPIGHPIVDLRLAQDLSHTSGQKRGQSDLTEEDPSLLPHFLRLPQARA